MLNLKFSNKLVQKNCSPNNHVVSIPALKIQTRPCPSIFFLPHTLLCHNVWGSKSEKEPWGAHSCLFVGIINFAVCAAAPAPLHRDVFFTFPSFLREFSNPRPWRKVTRHRSKVTHFSFSHFLALITLLLFRPFHAAFSFSAFFLGKRTTFWMHTHTHTSSVGKKEKQLKGGNDAIKDTTFPKLVCPLVA